MTNESYTDMTRRHQREYNALPIKAAFSNKQFEEMCREFGITQEQAPTLLYKGPGPGNFHLKSDSDLIWNTINRLDDELRSAIAADKSGMGFIRDMFIEELNNHEFNYTGDPEDAISALGYTYDDITNNKALMTGLKSAMAYCH